MTLVTRIANAVLPWAAGHATVWPSQHAVHVGLFEELKAANRDAINMGVAIRLALAILPDPATDDDEERAVATVALQGALSHHDRRMFA